MLLWQLNLEASGALSGTSAGTCTVTGVLYCLVSGSSDGTSAQTGDVTGTGALAAADAGTCTVAGTLYCLVDGSSAGSCTPSATLTGTGALAGSSAGTSEQAGVLCCLVAGSSAGTSSQTGLLYCLVDGTSAGTSSQTGAVTGAGSLSATDAGTCTVTGVLYCLISGSSDGTSSQTGAVTGGVSTGIANATRVDAIADTYGRQLTAHIPPQMQVWKSFVATSTQTGTAIWTPAAGKKIAITSLVMGTFGSTPARALLWFGASGTTVYTPGTHQLVAGASFAPSTSGYPGLSQTLQTPIYSNAADLSLRVSTNTGLSFDLAVYGYEMV